MKNANYEVDWFKTWNETTAYFLGLWLADGCISINKYKRKGRVFAYKRVFITNTDQQIMLDVGNRIRISPNLKESKKSNELPVMNLCLNSDELFDWLYSFVGSIDKTHHMKWFEFGTHMNHFVRGFFDGDGSIFIKNYSNRHGRLAVNLSSSFTASSSCYLYLTDLRNYLTNLLGLSQRKVVIGASKSTSKLLYGQYDTMLLCDWMYNNASLFMHRKKLIYDSFDKDKLMASTKYFSNKQ